jgi:hypothetical protein
MQVRMRDYLSLIVSQSTGQPYDRVIRELSRNKWMDPKQVSLVPGDPSIQFIVYTSLPKAVWV